MTQGGNTYFYHANAHGDIVKVTNGENEVVASYTYDAWGNITSQSGSFANENPYRYAGYRYDTESKFYYLIARYYNPETGSFISLDPDGGKLNDPQSQNGYNYANNNPVMGIDPDGHWVWIAAKVVGGFAIGAAAGYINYKMQVKYGYRKYNRKDMILSMAWGALTWGTGGMVVTAMKSAKVCKTFISGFKAYNRRKNFIIGIGVSRRNETYKVPFWKPYQQAIFHPIKFYRNCKAWGIRRYNRIMKSFRR